MNNCKCYPHGDCELKRVQDVVIELYEQTKAEDYVCSIAAFIACGAKGECLRIPVMTESGIFNLNLRPDRYCPRFQVWPLILTEEEKLRKRIRELDHQLQTIADMAKAACRE